MFRNYRSIGAVLLFIRDYCSEVTSVFQEPRAILALSAIFLASSVGAQSTDSFPAMPVDNATLRLQNQAEEVYERADYERAFFIYRNELVPIGDKWAQYNVGFMYLTGKGVEEDIVAASAWYRLAAERGNKQFVQVCDVVMNKLSAEQRAVSDRLFIELRQQYGDLALMTRAVRDDYETLRNRTGSRLGGDSGPVTIIDMSGAGGTRSAATEYGRIERRMKARLEYIARHANVDIVDLDSGNLASLDIDAVEAQVERQLRQLP